MFNINKEKFGIFDSVTISNPKHGIELQIINGFGAVINKYIVNHSPFSFITGYSDSEQLIEQHPFFSRSAKLFPFPNRLAHGFYHYQGSQYQLPANFPWSQHSVHGLLYNSHFDVVESTCDVEQASVVMRYKTQSLHTGYPFAFQLDITFHIDVSGQLTCDTTVLNTGDNTFPFGDAWHPYFSMGTSLSQCKLTMPSCFEVEHINDLPSGKKRAFIDFASAGSLSGKNFNNCFEFDPKRPVDLVIERNDHKASLHFQQHVGYRFVQLYTPQSEDTIAIEPMTCPADSFNNRIGLLELAPQQQQTFTWQCSATYHA